MGAVMSEVVFRAVEPGASTSAVSEAAAAVLAALVERSGVKLATELPLKVHFGEKGNRSFLPPETYRGIIGWLKQRGSSCCYIETSVLYGGERFERERHLRLAARHGFTDLPVVIADGSGGEDAVEVPVNLRHFRTASIARALAEAEQVVVLSHFKGHRLAGFGGAIKQLAMGFASKGGKMAMHMGIKPRIRSWKCRRCGMCLSRCREGAITIGRHPRIDASKCIGCGACFAICPHHAVSILRLRGLWNALFGGRIFREKLVEYARAAAGGKPHIYLNFAVNVTRGCDCEPLPMRRCVDDIGVFGSLDPVAVDAAALAAVSERGRRFRGGDQLSYAEKVGLGSMSYHLVRV